MTLVSCCCRALDDLGPSTSHAITTLVATTPRSYTFPKTLGLTVLSSEQLQEKYGIPRDGVPKHLDKEIKAFAQWSSLPIMLDRDDRYSHGVQSSTLEGHLKHIRGYMGFAAKYNTKQQPTETLSLTAYQDPELFASFISYLMARGVTRTPLTAHAGSCSTCLGCRGCTR